MNKKITLSIVVVVTLFSHSVHAILMTTQGDAPETDPAISTVVDDSGTGATTIRKISRYDVAKVTGASAGIELTQTTQSNLTYIPLSLTLGRNPTNNGLLELNLKLSYATENKAFKTSATATDGISDTTLGFSYYVRSPVTVFKTNVSIKFPTGEFDDQLSSDSTDYIVSFFARRSLQDFAIKGNAGYIFRGTGPLDTDWGDSYILKAGAEYMIDRYFLVGMDATLTDTKETKGPFALIGITTSDLALYADYRLDESSGIYARISAPVSEDVTGGPAPDRDSTFSVGFSVRY